MSSRTEQKQQSIERILDAALDVFARRGYERATAAAIAAAAGVSKGLPYHYFSGKPALLRAVLARGMARVQATFKEAERGGSPADRIAGLVRAALNAVRQDLRFWHLFYSLRWQPDVLGELAADLDGFISVVRGRLAVMLTEAGVADPETEALLLFALVDGAAQHLALEPDTYPADAVVRAVRARYAPDGV